MPYFAVTEVVSKRIRILKLQCRYTIHSKVSFISMPWFVRHNNRMDFAGFNLEWYFWFKIFESFGAFFKILNYLFGYYQT